MTMASVPEARGDESTAYAFAPGLDCMDECRVKVLERVTYSACGIKCETLNIGRQSSSSELQGDVVCDPMRSVVNFVFVAVTQDRTNSRLEAFLSRNCSSASKYLSARCTSLQSQ